MGFRAARVMPVRTSRSMSAARSRARNWQQNRASIRAGLCSRTGAAFWTLLSRWCRRSRVGWERQVAVAGDQGEAAVAGGVVGDALEVDVGGEGVAGGEDFPVVRRCAGPAGSCLLVGLGRGLADGEGDPAISAGLG